MTYCPECMRHTTADVIPAFVYAGVRVPAFIVCTFCGWVIREKESA